MDRLKIVMRWLLGLLVAAAGVYHFVDPDFYVRIMPPYLPRPRELVILSGGFEIALGLLALVPRYAPAAGWGLIALLVAVFPANVHMAAHPGEFPTFSPAALWVRLPLQGVFVAWAYWCTRPPRPG